MQLGHIIPSDSLPLDDHVPVPTLAPTFNNDVPALAPDHNNVPELAPTVNNKPEPEIAFFEVPMPLPIQYATKFSGLNGYHSALQQTRCLCNHDSKSKLDGDSR